MSDPTPISRETVDQLIYLGDTIAGALSDLSSILRSNPDRPRSGDDWIKYWDQAESAETMLADLALWFGDMGIQWDMDHPEETQ